MGRIKILKLPSPCQKFMVYAYVWYGLPRRKKFHLMGSATPVARTPVSQIWRFHPLQLTKSHRWCW